MGCVHRWRGDLHENGKPAANITHFPVGSVGLLLSKKDNEAIVWLIGRNEEWSIPRDNLTDLDVNKTGDKYDSKICNICHCLKPVENFSRNQTSTALYAGRVA